jgi:cytochrome oxidase Cu insertion factor (SCO1/SenC/PrrC family)
MSKASLDGRPAPLTFLCVPCVDMCPMFGSEIRQVLAKLGPYSSQINVIAVSVQELTT